MTTFSQGDHIREPMLLWPSVRVPIVTKQGSMTTAVLDIAACCMIATDEVLCCDL